MVARLYNYSFNPATKQIVFGDVQIVDISKVQYIINVTKGITLYDYTAPTLITTDGTNVVTVSHSTAGMVYTDELELTYDFPIEPANVGAGTVTSVAASGGATGFSWLGSPIISSGTLTLQGTLNTTHGGTGLTSYSTGDIIYASAPNVLSKLPVSVNGRVLTLVGGIPSWQTLPTASGTVTSVAMTTPTGLSITGSPITTSGTLALSLTAGYVIPTTTEQTNWNTAYINRITSLTTTGTSGPATLIANVLNIPQYIGGVTADNGLTANTSTNIRLGGSLLQNTTINYSGFDFSLLGTEFNDIVLIQDGSILHSVGDVNNHAFSSLSKLTNGSSYQVLIDSTGNILFGGIEGEVDTVTSEGYFQIYAQETGTFYSQVLVNETGASLKSGTSLGTLQGLFVDLAGTPYLDILANDNTEDKLVTWNSIDKKVEYRDVSTITGTGWQLTGNTVGANGNWIGTIDNYDFAIKINSIRAAYFGVIANVSLGSTASATGVYSFAQGDGTTANYAYSSAIGKNTYSTNSSSFAGGTSAGSTGIASFSFGQGPVASGDYGSLATGYLSAASGQYGSVAMGASSIASGVASISLGAGNFARAIGEVSVGNYGTDYTPAGTLADRVFNVGSSQDAGVTPGDAFTIYKNKKIKAQGYGGGTITGTPAYALNVDTSGNIIEGSLGGGLSFAQVYSIATLNL